MTVSTPRPKRPIHPWVLMLGVLILVGGFLGVFALVVAMFSPNPDTVLDERDHVMTDGSILRIEKVSFGTKHQLEFGSSGILTWWERLLGRQLPPNLAFWSTQHDQLTLCMSRRNAETGLLLDFDWWGETVVINALGVRVPDLDTVSMIEFRALGHSIEDHSARPLKADHRQWDHWIVCSTFPSFRSTGGTVTIEVENTSGNVMAKFDIQHPALPTFPTWSAEPLPSAKTDGDLTVALSRAEIKSRGSYRVGNRTHQQLYIEPSFDFRWKGRPTTDWRHHVQPTFDALGTPFESWTRESSREVLKVTVSAYKHRDATFEPAERVVIADVRLPTSGETVVTTEIASLGGATIQLLSLGGSGNTSAPAPKDLRYRMDGSIPSTGLGTEFQKTTKYFVRSRSGSNFMEVEADRPWLLFQKRGVSEGTQDFLFVSDDQGRNVPSNEDYLSEDYRLLFLNPEPDAKSITLTWAVTTRRTFEFFIEQPERPALPEAKAAQ